MTKEITLKDLDASLLWKISEDQKSFYWEGCPSLAEAQGVSFLCPECFRTNNGKVGTHMVICWFNGRNVPADMEPLPGRWNPSGTGLDDLTFVGPGAVSVLLLGGCNWHGFIRNGSAHG